MPSRRFWIPVTGAGTLAAAVAATLFFARPSPALSEVTLEPEPPEATAEQVRRFCGTCHAFPAPDTHPRAEWRKELRQAYGFFRNSNMLMDFPSFESVARYYEA